jgi:hypothetical protein
VLVKRDELAQRARGEAWEQDGVAGPVAVEYFLGGNEGDIGGGHAGRLKL